MCQFGHTVSNGPSFFLTSTICPYCSRKHGVKQGAGARGLRRIGPELPDMPRSFGACARKDGVFGQDDERLRSRIFGQGDMRILQRHLYIGIIFDTLKGRIFIGKEKFDKTMALLLELADDVETPGKVRAPVPLRRRVRPFLVPFNQFIGGPESALEWDTVKPIPDSLRHTM